MESPLVALLSSDGTDNIVSRRGFTSVAHLLAPFTSHTVTVRDSTNGQSQQSNVKVDIRDIRREGHLLSLSVLPHVLFEVILASKETPDGLQRFEDALRIWTEPTDQETLHTYLACIFVVSAGEENPLSELSKLIQQQHTQQHSSEAKPIGPSHCSAPKWTTPNTLKHYLLIHDNVCHDSTRTTDIFNQMCATYGVDACQLLSIGVGNPEKRDDLYADFDARNQQLEHGLQRAFQHASASSADVATPTSVATISPAYIVVPPMVSQPSTVSESKPSIPRHVSQDDCINMSSFVERFLRDSLIPHAERLMRTLNDQLSDRRGIGKSLTTGMRKWFGGSSSPSLQATTFASESVEMKSRRLADLAFQFGLFSLAHSQYRSVKKDFEIEQAHLHQAAALEMAAVALRLANPTLNSKQFPMYYLENAMNLLLSNGGKQTSIMRCALNSSRLLAELGQHNDAAMLLARISQIDNDLFVGVAQATAAVQYETSGKIRKGAFYHILAANRFLKCEALQSGIECYRVALNQYIRKGWDLAEDHLCSSLTNNVSDRSLAFECATHLLRGTVYQSEEDQQRNLKNFISTHSRFYDGGSPLTRILPLPLLHSKKTLVICGERPRLEEVVVRPDFNWTVLQRASFHAIFGNSTGFRPAAVQLVSDEWSDNREVRETPVGERFRVCFQLRNPLSIRIVLRNLKLSCRLISQNVSSEENWCSFNTLEEVVIDPNDEQVELSIIPRSQVHFNVDGLLLDLYSSDETYITGFIPVEIRGKRLNVNAAQRKSVIYAVDNRLQAKVSTNPWPMLDFKLAKQIPSVVFCSQAIRLHFEIQNIGQESVTSLCVATDGIDSVFVDAFDSSNNGIPCASHTGANSNDVSVYAINSPIAVGTSISLDVDVRAPTNEGPFIVSLLFFYRTSAGRFREWRYLVNVEAVSLLEAQVTALDHERGLLSLSLRNLLTAADEALARVDVLRVRAVKQELKNNREWEIVQSLVSLERFHCGQVQLDSDQTRTICFMVKMEEGEDHFWLSERISSPAWCAPLPKDEEKEIEHSFAILWRASFVDSSGHVSSLLGELFLPSPLSTIFPHEIGDDARKAFTVYSHPVGSISHDFSVQRLCHFPFSITVKNGKLSGNPAHVVLSFISKIPSAVMSMQQVPPDCRQLWWPDRLVACNDIAPGEQYTFKFCICVAQPAIYELGGSHLRIEAQTANGVFSLSSPCSLAVVTAI